MPKGRTGSRKMPDKAAAPWGFPPPGSQGPQETGKPGPTGADPGFGCCRFLGSSGSRPDIQEAPPGRERLLPGCLPTQAQLRSHDITPTRPLQLACAELSAGTRRIQSDDSRAMPCCGRDRSGRPPVGHHSRVEDFRPMTRARGGRCQTIHHRASDYKEFANEKAAHACCEGLAGKP